MYDHRDADAQIRSTPVANCDRDAGARRANDAAHHWAIVLAGGSGTRLAAMTRTWDGAVVPKQYCTIDGERSLLRMAIDRAARLVPRDHIVVVVAREHEQFWRRECQDGEGPRFLVQPENRGTAPGLLLPLLAIAQRDAAAVVSIVPADHFVAREAPLAAAMQTTQTRAAVGAGIVLLGIEPDGPEPDYGWILPVSGAGRWRPVAAFHEKPDVAAAKRLLARGAVWNTLLLSATADQLLAMFAARAPDLLDAFRHGLPHLDARKAAAVYRHLPPADFSRDMLQGSEHRLLLHIAPACGWTDLGTPERVQRCLASLDRRRQNSASPMLDLLVRALEMRPQD